MQATGTSTHMPARSAPSHVPGGNSQNLPCRDRAAAGLAEAVLAHPEVPAGRAEGEARLREFEERVQVAVAGLRAGREAVVGAAVAVAVDPAGAGPAEDRKARAGTGPRHAHPGRGGDARVRVRSPIAAAHRAEGPRAARRARHAGAAPLAVACLGRAEGALGALRVRRAEAGDEADVRAAVTVGVDRHRARLALDRHAAARAVVRLLHLGRAP